MKNLKLSMLTMLLLVGSCTKEKTEQPFLLLSETKDIVCSSTTNEQYVLISSTHSWTIRSGDDWCEVSHANRTNQKGNDILVVLKIAANTGLAVRETQITVTSEAGQSVQRTIRQDGTADVVPRLTSFGFKATANPLALSSDVVCTIDGDAISVLVPHLMPHKNLVPAFTFEGEQVLVNGKVQQSGQDTVNFSVPVEYVVQNRSGESATYTVRISSFTGLPIVFINTENNVGIVSKDDYVNANIRIVEDAVTTTSSAMKIKGRGNSTWTMPKKPYKMKFDSKISLLGEPRDKEWVLLANYADKTDLRNETALFMGRLSLLEWTPRTHFVEVFINEVYNGVYQLCEQIKIADDRVNVTDDGYLMEVDQLDRLDVGDVYFTTPRLLFNIKEPDVEQDGERYNWIKNYVTNVENLLYAENFDPTSGYAQYVDISSFVDWYLINEITKNNDAVMYTSCYIHIAPDGKLAMGPLWDFDISLGNINYNNNEIPTGLLIADAAWFQQLLKDPAFVAQVKTRFEYFKSKKSDILNDINSNATLLKWSVIENNNRWNTFYTYTWPNYAIWGAYDNEVQYMKNWLEARMEWLDEAFKDM